MESEALFIEIENLSTPKKFMLSFTRSGQASYEPKASFGLRVVQILLAKSPKQVLWFDTKAWADGGASVPKDWPDDAEFDQLIKKDWDNEFGDRKQEIVFIGLISQMNEAQMWRLDDCISEDYPITPENAHRIKILSLHGFQKRQLNRHESLSANNLWHRQENRVSEKQARHHFMVSMITAKDMFCHITLEGKTDQSTFL